MSPNNVLNAAWLYLRNITAPDVCSWIPVRSLPSYFASGCAIVRWIIFWGVDRPRFDCMSTASHVFPPFHSCNRTCSIRSADFDRVNHDRGVPRALTIPNMLSRVAVAWRPAIKVDNWAPSSWIAMTSCRQMRADRQSLSLHWLTYTIRLSGLSSTLAPPTTSQPSNQLHKVIATFR